MPRIGIIGGGIAGTQLGLFLRQHGIAATIYTEKTAEQHRAARISNVVVRNGLTRARERALGIDDWDGQAPDLVRLNLTVNGPQPIRFSGALDPPSQVVDMRIYWARLLEAFASRGGDLVFGTVSSRDVESSRRSTTCWSSPRAAVACATCFHDCPSTRRSMRPSASSSWVSAAASAIPIRSPSTSS